MVLTWKIVRRAICAAALVALSAELASAAPARLARNTNLRQGPGINFGVVVTVPGGSLINIIRCGVEWCNVTWRGRPGYMISRNLVRGAPVRIIRRPAVVVAPAAPVVIYGGPYYWGPRYYIGPRYYWRRW
jgi:uncharacterized protein YraI